MRVLNHPKLAKRMSSKMVQQLLLNILKDVDQNVKEFLIMGPNAYLNSINSELLNSYEIKETENTKDRTEVTEVLRIFDNTSFKKGDKVKIITDHHRTIATEFIIDLMYENERGLIIKLKDNDSWTWRELNQIKHV